MPMDEKTEEVLVTALKELTEEIRELRDEVSYLKSEASSLKTQISLAAYGDIGERGPLRDLADALDRLNKNLPTFAPKASEHNA